MTSLAILIAKDWFALATIILVVLIDRSMQPCESLRFNHCSSFALAFEDFYMVRRDLRRGRTCLGSCNSRCIRTCSFASLIAIEEIFRDYHRDWPSSIVPTRCSSRLDGAVVFNVASTVSQIVDRRSWWVGSGTLVQRPFLKLRERDSASHGMLADGGLERRIGWRMTAFWGYYNSDLTAL